MIIRRPESTLIK